MNRARPRFAEVLLGAATLVLLSAALAFAFHATSDPALPLFTRYRPSLPQGVLAVSVSQARLLLGREGVLFVDARGLPEFDGGHIPRAVQLDPTQVPEIPTQKLARLAGAHQIVVYCEGPSCGASRLVARGLREMGLGEVYMMPEGWPGWMLAGHPVER